MNYIGLMQMSAGGYRRAMDNCWSKGFDIVAVPISNSIDCIKDGYDFDPLDVTSTEFNFSVILMLSDHWSLPDRMLNTYVMQKEVDMCRYLQNRNCMLLRLKKEVNTQQASMFAKLKGVLIIEIPGFNPYLLLPLGACPQFESVSATEVPLLSHDVTWRWWHSFSRKLDFNAHLRLVVELHPTIKPSDNAMNRWLSEPLEAVVLPREFFKVQSVTNTDGIKGCVTVGLTRITILIQLYHHNVNILVRASPNDPDLDHIVNFLRKLRTKYKPFPLHPLSILTNRLHVPKTQVLSLWCKQINELFKSDTFKYKSYAAAVNLALLDFNKTVNMNIGLPPGIERMYYVIVVAAPHAPIVTAVIKGALMSNCRVCIFRLTINEPSEYTSSCIVNVTAIGVKIVMCQCNIQLSELKTQLPVIDLIVCESFAAVEEGGQMPPYCVSVLLSCLHPVTGCCVPKSVTVYLRPIMSTRLYNSYRKLQKELAEYNFHSTNTLPFPSRNVFELARPQLAYETTYRYCSTNYLYHNILEGACQSLLVFRMGKDLDCMLNALRADYDVTLYENVKLSTHWDDDLDPKVNALSIMPIYFMFKEPILLKPDEQIIVSFMRRITAEKFWFEWGIIGHSTQNCGGCDCTIQHQNKLF